MTYEFLYDSAALFLSALAAGVGMGVVRTVQIFLRRVFLPEKGVLPFLLRFTGDLLFCLFFTVLFLAVTYSLNDGGIRIFAVLSALAGCMAFYLLVDRFAKAAADRIAPAAKRFSVRIKEKVGGSCRRIISKVKVVYEKKRKSVFKNSDSGAADGKHRDTRSEQDKNKRTSGAERAARRNGPGAERKNR